MADRELKIAQRGGHAALLIDGKPICYVDNELVVDGVLNAVLSAYKSGFLQAVLEAGKLVYGVRDTVLANKEWTDERPERDEEAE